MYGCDVTVLLNVYCYLVFVGEGWLALVRLHLPHLRHLVLWACNVVDYYAEELRYNGQRAFCDGNLEVQFDFI